jgi:hypothetical protein
MDKILIFQKSRFKESEKTYDVSSPSNWLRHFPRGVGNHLAALDDVDEDRYAVGQIESNDGDWNNSIECTGIVSNCSLERAAGSYLEDPRKIRPKIITRTVVRYKAFRGTSSFRWTLEKKGEAGRPPSRPKA